MRIIRFSRNVITLLAGALCLLPMLLPPAANAGITFTNIFSFAVSNGSTPVGTLVQGKEDGKLYGVCQTGGLYGHGDVYCVGLDGSFTNLSSFDGTNETEILNGLVEANGSFYGVSF